MADEVQVLARLTVVNGNLSIRDTASTKKFDQATIGGPSPGYMTIGTTEESHAISELGTYGWLKMENLDATNYVQWGITAATYAGRMEAGEPALFRMEPGIKLFLKANTASCKVLIMAFEN